jgi:hypothetical protein
MIGLETNLESNQDFTNFKLIESIKENEFKIIYSDKFEDSKYKSNFLKIKNIIDINFFNLFIKEIKKNELSDEKKYLSLNNNLYLIEKVNTMSNYIFTIFSSFINRNVIEHIENNFPFEKYSLIIKNLQLLDLNESFKSDYSKNIINFKSNNYEFLLFINISTNNNVQFKLSNENIILEPCTALFFSNKIEFDIISNSNKSDYLIILSISYFNGYNRYEYNKHPNQNFFN